MFNQFRTIWADHGDDVSRQYAGTGALKSGFTRTGAPPPPPPPGAPSPAAQAATILEGGKQESGCLVSNALPPPSCKFVIARA